MERKKKRSKISALESCYANRIYGTFGVEMRAYGQKLVKFCTQTHRRVNLSSIDELNKLTFRLHSQCYENMVSWELIQMQHFCHHGESICHPNLSYVTSYN